MPTPESLRVSDRTLVPYLAELGKTPLLTADAERDLARRSRAGDTDARDRLITANLRFVVWIARGYRNLGLPFADLVNEGNLGLIEAVKRFDERRGTRLITYAAWWIRYMITSALASRRLVRLPVRLRQTASRLRSSYLAIAQKLGHEPTIEELARELQVSARELSEAFLAGQDELSLDALVADDSHATWQELMESATFPSPEEAFQRAEMRRRLKRALATLNPRERDVVTRYFGLKDGAAQTLRTIGADYRISREAVRQIKDRALAKLKTQIAGLDLRVLSTLAR